MRKRKILTEEQKERYAETRILKRANRTPEEVEKEKAKRQEYTLSEEQKANNSIYRAQYYQENKEELSLEMKKWYKANPEKKKAKDARFKENNPDWSKEYAHRHDLGYWVVYILANYNGLGDNYCGQTQNIYRRMASHKHVGKLNTDTYELIKQCETLEDALEFEAYMHEQGYHGKSGRPFI